MFVLSVMVKRKVPATEMPPPGKKAKTGGKGKPPEKKSSGPVRHLIPVKSSGGPPTPAKKSDRRPPTEPAGN